jgi:hypothetical protein
MHDRQSWAIKDDLILDDLTALMNLIDQEKSLLGDLKGEAESRVDRLGEVFYKRLLAHPPTAEYFLDDKMVDHVRSKLQDWFIQLFQGDYNNDYVKSRLVIGEVHVRIGLPVRYPLAMMDVMLKFGEEVTNQSPRPDQAKLAFHKLLALDIAIFNQSYEDNQLRRLAEMVGNERLARRLLTQR